MIDGFIALYIFMLAAFTGYEIIGKVPAILHTPLMSGSNFIHGIVLVGAMVAMPYYATAKIIFPCARRSPVTWARHAGCAARLTK